MALYSYVKKDTENKPVKKNIPAVEKPQKEKKHFSLNINIKFSPPKFPKFKNLIKFPSLPKVSAPKVSNRVSTSISLLFIACGIGMILIVAWPILKWQIIHPSFAPESKLVKPIAQSKPENINDGQALANEGKTEENLNYASNWFPETKQDRKNEKIVKYEISIPKLKIENALTLIGGEDLSKSLIHFGGTALPGEYGNAVIFGHSVLPEFFNPKDYHTIFATMPELKLGDEIYATVDNVKYKYIIYEFKTVDPSDITVLEQRYDNYYMSLITCVPPGLKLKRLVAKAKLVPFDEEIKEEEKNADVGN